MQPKRRASLFQLLLNDHKKESFDLVVCLHPSAIASPFPPFAGSALPQRPTSPLASSHFPPPWKGSPGCLLPQHSGHLLLPYLQTPYFFGTLSTFEHSTSCPYLLFVLFVTCFPALECKLLKERNGSVWVRHISQVQLQ